MVREFNQIELEKLAHRIRWHIVKTIVDHGEGHAGPSLSCADILAVLYGSVMNYDSKNYESPDRDRLVLSAGHKCLALYGSLVEVGVIDRSVLDEYNQLGCRVPAHPDMTKLPGVEFSTGSLGHGLPLGCGMALAGRMKGLPYRVFVLMGDGEHGEGSVWEAAAYASANNLDNLVGILDRNGLQINGTTKQVCDTADLAKRYAAFGWTVKEVNGHDLKALYQVFTEKNTTGKPLMVVCNTIKSKGMPFAENNVAYHHWNPGQEEKDAALKALREYEARWN